MEYKASIDGEEIGTIKDVEIEIDKPKITAEFIELEYPYDIDVEFILFNGIRYEKVKE